MQSDRQIQMEAERLHLEEEKLRYPELFPTPTWVDDNEFLEKLGIHIPGKESLPQGFLKLLPSDFIVEEEPVEGVATDIYTNSEDSEDKEGETVYATLVKCGLSTLEAMDELSKLLNIPKEKLQYAGIKDKEAITSQQISIRGIRKEEVMRVSSPHFFLKDIRQDKGVVQKGGLKGNRFSILIRIKNEDMDNKVLMDNALRAVQGIKDNGFYNFFYLQRFGSPRFNNYKWGISILKGQYEKAIRGVISDPGLREIPYFLKKRSEMAELFPQWDKVLERLREFPLVFPSEIKMVEHLINNPGDYVGALQKVEDQVVLWVSAVASLVVNRKISAANMAGLTPPKLLPLFLSLDRNDWLPYSEDLEGLGFFPPDFRYLRPFRKIMLKHKDIETKDQAHIHAVEIVPQGIAINFSLGKGEYATSFLSHFVNLLGGEVPEGIDKEVVDVKKVLGNESAKLTLEYFKIDM